MKSGKLSNTETVTGFMGFVDEDDDALEDYVNSLFGGSELILKKSE